MATSYFIVEICSIVYLLSLHSLENGPITQDYSHTTAASKMEGLMAAVKKTVILFDALRRLGVSERMYKDAKAQDMPLGPFQNAVKIEKVIVQSAKKNTLWVKKMEHIMEKLVYIVHFLPSEINCVFYKEHEEDGSANTNESPQQTLGSHDLQLHYAKIITAIQNLFQPQAFVTTTSTKSGIDSLFRALP
ncbi:protein PSK SIMULATOR 3-like, partial [Oryza brachyantha]|uniref:protein PSK SIMULATOR 3-like n=1 Tax=Oryza brachyantha TaxID=4533 RepID=UPI001ADCA43D